MERVGLDRAYFYAILQSLFLGCSVCIWILVSICAPLTWFLIVVISFIVDSIVVSKEFRWSRPIRADEIGLSTFFSFGSLAAIYMMGSVEPALGFGGLGWVLFAFTIYVNYRAILVDERERPPERVRPQDRIVDKFTTYPCARCPNALSRSECRSLRKRGKCDLTKLMEE